MKTPPEQLTSDPVQLIFREFITPVSDSELVPCYHFKIAKMSGQIVGHINFRVGSTAHIQYFAGNIGYEVHPEFRGQKYSLYACRAIEPFVAEFYSTAYLTAEPNNIASIRIIKELGCEFLDERVVPKGDPAYQGGARTKRRYLWRLTGKEAQQT